MVLGKEISEAQNTRIKEWHRDMRIDDDDRAWAAALKTVDLTKAGLAIPVVDELATIPLDLWARERGYEKLQINLLGT
jgi:formate dehydrogenase maturation protein FdhE